MKKLLVCLLALLLAASAAALAQEDAVNAAAVGEEVTEAPLTAEELNAWTEMLIARAITENVKVEKDENGFTAMGRGYRLMPASEDLSPDTVLKGAVLDGESVGVEGLYGPRTLLVSQSAGAVLASFPNDNQGLQGTDENAVLYIRGGFPEKVMTGVATRAGQNIKLLEYCVYTPSMDGVERAGVQFTVEDGMVSAIRYFGGETLSAEEAAGAISQVSSWQESTQYQSLAGGGDAAPMQREDLVFGALDFIDVTPENAVQALGAPAAEERVDDADGSVLYTMQWENLHLTFVTDKDGGNARADNAVVIGPMAGPRGARVEDDLLHVLSLFKNEADSLNIADVALYGGAENPAEPYGHMVKDESAQVVYYSVPVGEKSVLVTFTFIGERLANFSFANQ